MASDVTQLIRRLRRLGWRVERRRNGHWRVTGPQGQWREFPATPSDYRSLRNTRAQLRRIGAHI